MLKWSDKLDRDKGKVNLIYIQATGIETALAMTVTSTLRSIGNISETIFHNYILEQNRVFVKSIV